MTKKYIYEELRSLLRVDAPLLMLDRLLVDPDNRSADGLKLISMNNTVFQGHFPGQPVLPGVLQVAAMAQASKALFLACCPGQSQPTVTSLRKVKFRTPVTPGMALQVSCVLSAENPDGSVEFQVKNHVDGDQLASSGYVTLARRAPEWFTPVHEQGEAQFMIEARQNKPLDPVSIMHHIPHRYPFMLVDRAFGLDDITKVVGFKNVSGSDPLLSTNAPAVFPCYLQIEAGAQLGCAAMLAQPENKGLIGFFMSIDSADFFRPVLPGDRLDMRIVCEPRGKFGLASGEFYVGPVLAARGEIKFALVQATDN